MPIAPFQFALFAVAVLLAATRAQDDEKPIELAPPAPIADGRIAKSPHVDGISCTRCHQEIAQEWSQTLHALAWLSEPYQEEIADKQRPQGCWGCHIPEALHREGGEIGQKPPARADQRELGIWCETCHLGPDGSILGPYGAPTDAHRSVKHENFVDGGSVALCSSCHSTNIGPVIGIAKDFASSNKAAKELSCVGCHMQPVERPIANPTEAGQPAYPPRKGRSHALQTPRDPRFLAQAFALDARVEGGKTIVRVANRAGHRVPGLLGREMHFAIEGRAGSAALAPARIDIDHRAFLPVDGVKEVALDGAADSVRVVATHEDPRLDEPVQFLEVELKPSASR